MNAKKNKGVPCPLCLSSKVPGQIERPKCGRWDAVKDDFGLNKLPPHIQSTPCPMCQGKQRISDSVWAAFLDRARKIARKHMDPKPKKEKPKEPQKPEESMWGEMRRIKAEQKRMWMKQGPFPFKKDEQADK